MSVFKFSLNADHVLAQLQFFPGLNDTRTILRLNPSRVRSACTSQEFKVSWFWSKFLPQAQYYPEVRGMDWTLTLVQMGWSHGTSFLKGSMEVYLAYDPGIHCTSISASPENVLIGWSGRLGLTAESSFVIALNSIMFVHCCNMVWQQTEWSGSWLGDWLQGWVLCPGEWFPL